MPQCSQCGRELTSTTTESICESCRQRDFAVHAEQSAEQEPQQRFVITNILLGINIGVFALMVLRGVPVWTPNADQVVHWGANFGPLTLGTQPWRLLTNVFLHLGIVHLITNMWALLVLGRLAEALYRRKSFLFVYLASGIAGSLASTFWNPIGVSAGASGALFGLAGALIATLIAGKLPLPKKAVRPVLLTLLFWAALDLAYGFWKTGVDNAAHVGGLIAGAALGYALGHHLGPGPKEHLARQKVYSAMVLVLALFGFITLQHNGYVVGAERARVLMTANKNDEAIAVLRPVIEKAPKEIFPRMLMADLLIRKSQFEGAESELKSALQVGPKNGQVWAKLAEVQMKQQRWEDAAASFKRAAELTKDNGYFWYNSGVAYRQSDRHEDAVKMFQTAVSKNPYLVDAWFAMGISLLNLKKNPEGIQALQKAVQLRPNDAEIHLWLGNALLASGKEQEAQGEFLRAFQIRAAQQRAIQQQQQMMRQRQQGASPGRKQ
ncbi:MAG TPA: rhomboid family intramembrane serine protease [Terriglobales bacterium]|nr:rhomboid family intramembrane serine protease [Terriglobales bacterium]